MFSKLVRMPSAMAQCSRVVSKIKILSGMALIIFLSAPACAANAVIALSSTVNPSEFGQQIQVTASASGNSGTPTGTVVFYDGSTPLSASPLNQSGSAVLTVSNLTVGSHSLTAIYGGDSVYGVSVSNTLAQAVNKADTSVVLLSDSNPAVYGELITFTANVIPAAPGAGTPTGKVLLYNGTLLMGAINLSNGSGSISVAGYAPASYPFKGVYTGDSNFNTSTSGVLNQVVDLADSAGAVTSTDNPSVFGESLTLTASFSAVAPASGTPTGGNVTFYDSAALLGSATLSNGTAQLSVSSFSTATHSITAVYNGDSNFNGSTSVILLQAVNPASTTAAVTSSLSPSVYGGTVTFTASIAVVAPGQGLPTGSVSFYSGAGLLGTSSLNSGSAQFSTSALSAGNHNISVMYTGDANFNSSLSGTFIQEVDKDNTATAMTADRATSVFGQQVIFSAGVGAVTSRSTPTGSIAMYDGANLLGTTALDNTGAASFNIATLATGSHTLTANYSGDQNFNASTSSSISFQVTQAATSASLSISPTSSVFGQAVTLTAFAAPVAPGSGIPTGNVVFLDGISVVGSAALDSNGTAKISVTLPVGAHGIAAFYAGDTNFSGSASSTAQMTVSAASTTTALASSLNPAVSGNAVTFTATVTLMAPGAGSTDGILVTFFDSNTSLGSAALSGGTATFSTTTLSSGTHSLTATFAGSANFTASTSAPLIQTVTYSSTTTLTAASASLNSGDLAALTAQVSSPGGVPHGGTVTVAEGTTTLASAAPGSDGSVVFNIAGLTTGTHQLTAAYSGNSSVAASLSASVSITVAAPVPSTPPDSSNTDSTTTPNPAPSQPYVSGLNVTPSVAIVGQTIQFVFTVVDNLSVTYKWDFGDGTGDNNNTSSPSHAYSTEGIFTVTATATDSAGQVLNSTAQVSITQDAAPGSAKELLTALGNSSPLLGRFPAPDPMSIFTTKITVNFVKRSTDSLYLNGQLNFPAGQKLNNMFFAIDIGGIIKTFTLDASGRDNSNSKDRLKVNSKTARFLLQSVHGNFFRKLYPFGLTSGITTGSPVTIPVSVVLGGGVFEGYTNAVWACNGRNGVAR